MSIPAQDWNAGVGLARRGRVVAGEDMRIARGAHGQTVSAFPRGGWRHPWTISPRWEGAGQRWMATVAPGW